MAKATTLIKNLQEIVDKYGDREVEVNGKWNNDFIITPYSFLEIDSIDIFVDSDNIQILVKNG